MYNCCNPQDVYEKIQHSEYTQISHNCERLSVELNSRTVWSCPLTMRNLDTCKQHGGLHDGLNTDSLHHFCLVLYEFILYSTSNQKDH